MDNIHNSYLVYATLEDREHLLGAFSGEKHDIQAFLADKAGYGLKFEPLKIAHIPDGFAARMKVAKDQMDYLKRQMKEIEDSVK